MSVVTYTLPEIAIITRIPVYTLRTWYRDGLLTAYCHSGTRPRFRLADVTTAAKNSNPTVANNGNTPPTSADDFITTINQIFQ